MMSLNLHSKQLSLEQQARPSFHWKWLEAIKGLSGVPPAPNTKDALTLSSVSSLPLRCCQVSEKLNGTKM